MGGTGLAASMAVIQRPTGLESRAAHGLRAFGRTVRGEGSTDD